jgi:LytS/YehU family sensor histidine kinase
MRRDVEAADEMLTHLGDLLHRTLRQGGRHEVTLGEELELLRHYTDIMKIRFQDRLAVRVDVDEAVLPALVPNLVLQPLVENAIRHGISRKPGAGLLEIAARRDGATLEISVRDDGEGLSGAEEGVGLSNTRRRLRQLYGEAQSLELVPGGEGGLMVRMRLPMRTAA